MGLDGSGDGIRGMLDTALTARDKSAAVAVALSAVEAGDVTIPDLYAVLASILAAVGDRWQSGDVCVWEEHLASSTVRTIIEALYPRVSHLVAARGHDRGTVLLTCPPHEAHDLGLRMLSDRLELAGWTVYFLGADTPRDEIVAAARSLGVDAVVLSISTHFHRVAFRYLLTSLHEALPEVRILTGGPALSRGTHGIPDADLFERSGLLETGE